MARTRQTARKSTGGRPPFGHPPYYDNDEVLNIIKIVRNEDVSPFISKFGNLDFYCDLWPYLSVTDIKILASVSGNCKLFCIQMNKHFYRNISMKFYEYISVKFMIFEIENCQRLFPNIRELQLKGAYKVDKMALIHLFDLKNLQNSLRSLSIIPDYVFIDNDDLCGINKLKNLYYLKIKSRCLGNIKDLPMLTSLNISECLVTSLFPIATMTSLTVLDISDCEYLTDEGFSFISSLTNLTDLNMQECDKISDNGLSFLTSLKKISSLNISECLVTSLFPIATLTSLTVLDISDCEYLTDEGFSFISSLTNLTDLNMSNCIKISDKGLSFLASLRKVSILNIFSCFVTSLSPLSIMTNLTLLDISCCKNLTDEGFSFISSLTNLTDLNMQECDEISDNGLSFLTSLKKISILNICHCNKIRSLFPIATLTNLTVLDILCCKNLTDEGFSFISSLTNLTDLNMQECDKISDKGLSFLTSLRKISILNIYFSCFVTSLSPLSIMTNLTVLDISCCKNLTDEGFSFISSLTNLTDLNMQGCDKISDKGLSFLTSLKKISSLNISECCKIKGNAGLFYISSLVNIQTLEMSLMDEMTSEGFDHLCKLTNLIDFHIKNEGLDHYDISLSPTIIDKFVKIKSFSFYKKRRYDWIKDENENFSDSDIDKLGFKGFHHVVNLRNL